MHVQTPSTHACAAPQAIVHEPQWSESVSGSTHALEHSRPVRPHGPASEGPASGAASGSGPASRSPRLVIQARMQSASAGSGKRPSGMRAPHSGSSELSFSTRKDASGSPGTTSVRPRQLAEGAPTRRCASSGETRSRP